MQAEDADEGVNGELRYQILNRANGRDEKTPSRFSIDPVTGQVSTASSFAKDAGRVFGFDVKATDKAGGEDGRSSIVNVFVSPLSLRSNSQLLFCSKDRIFFFSLKK